MPCSDIHQSFTGIHVKWFLENFPMFADVFLCSFYSLRCPGIRCKLSIKCSASRGGSLRQHGFLVLCSFDMTRRILFYSAFIVVVQFSSICTKVNQMHSCLLVLIVTGYVSCESVKIYLDKETARV